MKDLLISIRRTPYQSLANFLVLFFNLFLSLIIIFLLCFLYGLLNYVESRPQVTVYFKTETAESDIFKLRDTLMNSGKVESIKYISQEEAFNIYKELNKDNPLLLEMVSADILPASLEIYAKKPLYLPEIAEFLKKQPGVDEVNFQKVIIDRLLTLTNIIKKSSFVFFGFLVFITIIILMTITNFKVALKKDEIELLRLLGADGFYIKKPFINEAIFFGFFSSLTAFLIFDAIIFYLNPFMNSYLKGINSLVLNFEFYKLVVWPINWQFLLIIFSLTTFFGIIISIAASLIAIEKYIK
ncbi:MAG: permease-like cell division protein FtsX [Microgenomates group bacterium]|nr:permease-like cell division protein FtsX [Microgenomates group bacterium]